MSDKAQKKKLANFGHLVGPQDWNEWSPQRKQREAGRTKNAERLYRKHPNHVYFAEGYLAVPKGNASPTEKRTVISSQGLVKDLLFDITFDDEFLKREQELRRKRESLKENEDSISKILEASGLSVSDFNSCLTPEDLRLKMEATGLSRAYIERNFPNLESDFYARHDLEDLKYEEFCLKFQKDLRKNPKKLYKRLDPEFSARLHAGEEPEQLCVEIHQRGLSISNSSGRRQKKIKALVDAGFTESDIINYKETKKKLRHDLRFKKKALDYVQNQNAERLAENKKLIGLRALNMALWTASLPTTLALDFAKTMIRRKKSPRTETKSATNHLKLLSTLASR